MMMIMGLDFGFAGLSCITSRGTRRMRRRRTIRIPRGRQKFGEKRKKLDFE